MDPICKGSLAEAIQAASAFLEQAGFDEPGLGQRIWLDYKDWTLNEMVAELHEDISSSDFKTYMDLVKKVAQGHPLAYLLNRAYFMGDWFKVTSDTLIPREETAGILHLALSKLENRPPHRILDVGTGSGILAIKLAQHFHQSQVWGTDISKKALAVAQVNSENLKQSVTWIESDLFQQIPDLEFDLIVSNPPYVAYEELELMDVSVVTYEPHQALFADNEGLSIYQAMAQEVNSYLKSTGIMILEIGYQQGQVVQTIFQQVFPKREVTLHQDYNGLDRYVLIEEESDC